MFGKSNLGNDKKAAGQVGTKNENNKRGRQKKARGNTTPTQETKINDDMSSLVHKQSRKDDIKSLVQPKLKHAVTPESKKKPTSVTPRKKYFARFINKGSKLLDEDAGNASLLIE